MHADVMLSIHMHSCTVKLTGIVHAPLRPGMSDSMQATFRQSQTAVLATVLLSTSKSFPVAPAALCCMTSSGHGLSLRC